MLQPLKAMPNPTIIECVYVHPKLVKVDGKYSIQFAAEVVRNGVSGLETFQYKCDSEAVASTMREKWIETLQKGGPFPMINMKGFPDPLTGKKKR